MRVLGNIGALATCRSDGGQGDLHVVERAALAWEDDRLVFVGEEQALPGALAGLPRIDAGGRLVIPGLVDCHTHLGFGGWRADELVRRIQGETYLDIARTGGGIARTVRETRALGRGGLLARTRGFLREMGKLGVTTVEAKSGYGLELEAECRVLAAYRELDETGAQRIVPTFLGAHVVPPEWRADRAGYVREVIERMLPRVAHEGLARFCDVFVEEGAFSIAEARAIFDAAGRLGLRAKLHADQLSDGGGALLAAELGAASADHLEHASQEGMAALGRAGVIGVTLPLATMYLGQRPAPARRLIDAGVRVAVSTDFNPGTAPSYHLPFALTLACTTQKMTPAEALKGATYFAAAALDLAGTAGSLEAGKSADFAVIDAPSVDFWLYHLRGNACLLTVARGQVVWSTSPFEALA